MATETIKQLVAYDLAEYPSMLIENAFFALPVYVFDISKNYMYTEMNWAKTIIIVSLKCC